MSCRFVRLNRTFVLTLLRSFGIGTYAIDAPFLNLDIKNRLNYKFKRLRLNIKLLFFGFKIFSLLPADIQNVKNIDALIIFVNIEIHKIIPNLHTPNALFFKKIFG